MQKEAEEKPIEAYFWLIEMRDLCISNWWWLPHWFYLMPDLLLWLTNVLSHKCLSSLNCMKLVHSRQGMKWDIWYGSHPTVNQTQINAHMVTDWKRYREGRILPLTAITHFMLIRSLMFFGFSLFTEYTWMAPVGLRNSLCDLCMNSHPSSSVHLSLISSTNIYWTGTLF